jgi:hypothetical protein
VSLMVEVAAALLGLVSVSFSRRMGLRRIALNRSAGPRGNRLATTSWRALQANLARFAATTALILQAPHVNCRRDRHVLGTAPFSDGPVLGAEVGVSASAGLQQAEHSMRLVTPARGLVWGPPYPRMFDKACLALIQIP